MRYATGYCFNATDLYDNFNTKQLKIRKDVVAKKYGLHKKQCICASVLIYCFYLILLDIIENNVTFVLPLFNGKHASIYIRPVVGEELKTARQRGAMQDIDLLASDFTGYEPAFTWESPSGIRHKPIYINRAMKEKLIQKINEGKRYY